MQLIRFLQTERSRRLIRKYRFMVMFFLLAAMVLCMKQIHPVKATPPPAQTDQIRTEIDNMLNGIHTTNVRYMADAYRQFADITGPVNTGTTGHGLSDRTGILVAAGPFITGLAMFFCLIFSVIGVIKESQRGEISMDYWTRILVSTVVAILVVANINMVMNSLYKTGDLIITRLMEVSKDANDVENTSVSVAFPSNSGMSADDKKTILHAMSLIPPFNGYKTSSASGGDASGQAAGNDAANSQPTGQTGDAQDANVTVGTLEDVYYGTSNAYLANQYIHSLMTPMQLVSLLPLLASMYLIYSMVFEIKLRQLFAPLAVSTLGYDGARAPAVRFLKKYLACYVRIGMYFVIATIGSEMTNYFYGIIVGDPSITDASQISVSAATALILMFGSNALAAITMMQAGGLADEIVGV